MKTYMKTKSITACSTKFDPLRIELVGVREELASFRIELRLLRIELDPLSTELGPLSEELGPLSEELGPLSEELGPLSEELPAELREAINSLGKRSRPAQLDDVICDLCKWRPLSLEELQFLTKRKMEHLRQRSLRRLLIFGRLAYLYPDNPTHPNQKYRAIIESEDK